MTAHWILTLTSIALGTTALFGCASSHNLETDGRSLLGGGYRETKLRDGIYRISVKTNWSPWVNTSAARSSWRARAQHLCGSDEFRELEIYEDSYDERPPFGGLRYIITTRYGFAVCKSTGLSDEAARELILGKQQ